MFYLTDSGIPDDVAALNQECISKFVCQILVTNNSLPSAAEGLTSAKLLHMLKQKLPSSTRKYEKAPIYNNNEKDGQRDHYAATLDTYSLHEWGEAIKLVLE